MAASIFTVRVSALRSEDTLRGISVVQITGADANSVITEASAATVALGAADTGLGADQAVSRAYVASQDVSTSTEGTSLAARPVAGDSGSVTEGAILGLFTADYGIAVEIAVIKLKGTPKPYAPYLIQAAEAMEAVLVSVGVESGNLEISEYEIPRLVSVGTAEVAIESARHEIPTITSSLR